MMAEMDSKVSLQRDGAVATITICRPKVRNALDLETWEQLSRCLATVRKDGAVRAVVLTGGDSFFSAGGDVGTMHGHGGTLFGPVERLDIAHEVIRTLAAMDKPVVAAVERYAIGVAWGLVLSCDLVVAGESTFFQAPFALRGLVADGAVAWHLPRHLGRQRATRVLLLGERLSVTDAFAAGVVSHIVPDGQVNRVSSELAATLASGPRESNTLTKSLIAQSEDLGRDHFLGAERVAVAFGAHGDDAAEGRAAFRENRSTRFRA